MTSFIINIRSVLQYGNLHAILSNNYLTMKKFFTQLIAIIFVFIAVNAHAQLNYKLANCQNLAGTWSDLGTQGSAVSFSDYDDENSSAQNIGFTFNFNGASYTQFVINTNGFIKLGTDTASRRNLFYTAASGTVDGALNSTNGLDTALIVAFNHDLGAGSSPEIRVATLGSAPNRICVIQWKGMVDSSSGIAQQYDDVRFQIKLYEKSNVVDLVYGPFTASQNTNAFKSAGAGLKGSSSATQSLLCVTKGSATAWNTITFVQGHYTGNALNHRNNSLPDSGRTARFIPTVDVDLVVTNIYAYGKIPIPGAIPNSIEARLTNVGTAQINSFYLYLKSQGVNNFIDSLLIDSMGSGSVRNFTFVNYNPTNLGTDNLTVFIPDNVDSINMNNSQSFDINVNLNAFSYSETTKPPSGGVGFTGGTGDFVAKFTSSDTNYINQIRVNFTTSNQNVRIGIWNANSSTKTPNSNLWTSPTFQTTGGLAVISVNPPVMVVGDFFCGVRQIGTVNCGFAFQYEIPIRDSVFYYTAPTGGTTWTDFSSSGSNFRFMIEPRLMLRKDAGVVKLVNPTRDTCIGGPNTPIVFQVQNLGRDTIFLNSDSMYVYAKAVDVYGDTTTFDSVVMNSGVIAPNDTMDVTISTTYDMTNLGDYYFWANTTWANDPNPANDTLDAVRRTANNPTADGYAYTPTSVCQGDTVFLTASPSNGFIFQWYRGSSLILNATDSFYYALSSGRYVCAVGNGTCWAYTDTIDVNVTAGPPVIKNNANFGYCPGDSVLLSTTSSIKYIYQWYYNGNPITNATDSSIYAAANGDYYVRVQDTSTGCVQVSANYVVNQFTPASGTISASKTRFCLRDSSLLSAPVGSGYSYQWTFNGSNITNATGQQLYVFSSGDYGVTIKDNNGCSANIAAVTITVDSLPDATITPSGVNQYLCNGSTLTLTVPAGNSYQWFKDGSPISGATSNSYMVTGAGNYSVKVSNSNNCSDVSSTINVTIQSPPNASIKNPSQTSFCKGDSLMLEAASTGTGWTYEWMLNGTPISGANNSSHYANVNGNYTVKITNNFGCSATSSGVSLTYQTSPDPIASAAGGQTTTCEGDSLRLNSAFNGTPSAIQWKFNGSNIAGATSASLYAKQSGSYSVYVALPGGCTGTSQPINITVNPKPVPVITAANPNLSTSIFTTYQWYFNGNMINGATSQNYKPGQNGDYEVEVTDANGCKGRSAKYTVIWTQVINPAQFAKLEVFPNPSQGIYFINLISNSGKNTGLKITDIVGKVVFAENVQQSNLSNFAIDLSRLTSGIYFLEVWQGNDKAVVRLVKE